MRGLVLLVAGGTGGHLFPAEALAIALAERGWRVHLATDHRIDTYGHDFPAEKVHFVSSATITRSPVAAVKALVTLGSGFFEARRLLSRLKPAVVVGFGGYPTVPPVLAAALAGVPTIIHEQNAVLGRANRFLAPRVRRIATSFAEVGGASAFRGRVVQTGNPVRPAVREAAATAYPVRAAGDPFRLLVFGGSQGARFLSDLVPAAIASLAKDMPRRLRIVQQCRPEDIERVRRVYRSLGVDAELQPFFADLPKRIADAHLVVCRSGASTCAELAVIGRPAIMVPLPHALDQDQKANANVLAGAGGGWMMEQGSLTPQRLGAELEGFVNAPERLARAAAAARAVGRPDAVERLADLVGEVASGAMVAAEARVTA
ncbi:MAG: undecaprenyldiphospho-muramoylpentapeptide beta-N-acetylglucosaminyltransferase [Bauldia sp.]|nr:undecaprenyldiphospho-muramoylpentapeptide beta-N-acetylglucosaminyltransferase [Bauldia sp.]